MRHRRNEARRSGLFMPIGVYKRSQSQLDHLTKLSRSPRTLRGGGYGAGKRGDYKEEDSMKTIAYVLDKVLRLLQHGKPWCACSYCLWKGK